MYLTRVENQSVWQSLKVVFIGALLLFLINIYFGFDNSLTSGPIDRWQVLLHLHSGSIGWITLSAIGVAIWTLTGTRTVTAQYEKQVHYLVWAAVIAFGLYVPSFGLAFSRPSGFLVALLPTFGLASVLVLWTATIFGFSQFKKQETLTTVHILIVGALLTASIGGTVGMLLGLERVVGQFLPLPQGDRVGAHAAMMDTYLFLVASTIVEWGLRKQVTRWNWAGMLQALTWIVGAALVPLAFFLNIVEQILPIFGMLLIIGMVTFLARFGWRAVAALPTGAGVKPWAFFGTLWLVIYMGLFLYAVMGTGGDFSVLPTWFFAVFAHAGFVGMMTNLILSVAASRGKDALHILPWGETASVWAINLGLVAFIALKIAADIRLGAIIMGLGVLLGVFTVFRRIQES